jgi:hypothetical protein
VGGHQARFISSAEMVCFGGEMALQDLRPLRSSTRSTALDLVHAFHLSPPLLGVDGFDSQLLCRWCANNKNRQNIHKKRVLIFSVLMEEPAAPSAATLNINLGILGHVDSGKTSLGMQASVILFFLFLH